MTLLYRLIYEFFKIGLFAVGGGQATIPFLYDLSLRTNWFTFEKLADMIAISESTPGPIGVNMATYTGFTVGGMIGGVLATLALVTPSVIVIIGISKALDAFKENRYIKNIFKILKPCVVGLISAAGLSVFTIAVLDVDVFNQTKNILDLFKIKEFVLFIVLFAMTLKWKKHPIVYLGIAMIVGILLGL